MSIRPLALLAIALSACAPTELVHELDEREANEVLVTLNEADPPVAAKKVPDTTPTSGGGNKGARYMIVVPPSEANHAWKLLKDNSLPKRKDTGLGDVFSGGGLVPTESEEKAKMLQGVQGELARTLKSIDGILDARVHVVMPEDSVLRAKEEDKALATASVWYKYAPRDSKAIRPLSDQEVRELIANAVEKLKPENVKVIATPALAMLPPEAIGDAAGAAAIAGMQTVFGITVVRSDVTKLKSLVAGAAVLIVLLTFLFLIAYVKKGGGPKRPTGMTRAGGDTSA